MNKSLRQEYGRIQAQKGVPSDQDLETIRRYWCMKFHVSWWAGLPESLIVLGLIVWMVMG
jgi:hypothetical protein